MTKVLWTATALLVLHAAHSYILLTANIEDVQNVAKRLVQSPITGQVGNIMRRAYSVFNNHLGKARTKADDSDVLGYNRDDRRGDSGYRRNEDSSSKESSDSSRDNEVDVNVQQERKHSQSNEGEYSFLGKSASVYLQKIKNIFDNA